MRILLTNDDGYASPGIMLLADSLREAGHKVYVVAPDKNRSGASHSIEFLNNPVKLTETGADSWSCSGTPVDCVITALLGGVSGLNITGEGTKINMKNAPDLVLSGINAGANLGTDIIYSGTAAAARQGSFFGIPSIALSLVENKGAWHWEPVVSYITEKLDLFIGYSQPNSFININFPNTGKKPLSLIPVFPSMRYYNDRIITYSAPEGGLYCFAKTGQTACLINDDVPGNPKEGSDWAEVKKGNAALSVISAQPVPAQPQVFNGLAADNCSRGGESR